MKFTPRKIRAFLKKGMRVTVIEPVDVSREYESSVFMHPGEVGLVKGIKCPVVRIILNERRPYNEFVLVLIAKEVDGKMSERRAHVSYDNIQLISVLAYLSERVIARMLTDMGNLNAHGLSWSGISETYLTIKYTLLDGLREERRYDLHVKDSM